MHKFQGWTEDYMLIELNEYKFHPSITSNMLLVLISWVGTGNNLKNLPLLNGKQSLDYLRKLRPDPDIAIWRKGFDDNGVWSHDRARNFAQSMQQKRPPKKGCSNTPATFIFRCTNTFNLHIGATFTILIIAPSRSTQPSITIFVPAPPSARPWALNLL